MEPALVDKSMDMSSPLETSQASHTEKRRSKGILTALISLASVSFGVLSLALTGNFANVGGTTFIIMLIFSSFLNYYSSSCLTFFAETHKLQTFTDFSKKICHPSYHFVVDFAFFLMNFGGLIVPQVFLNNFTCQVAKQITSIDLLINPARYFWLIFFSVIGFPIVMIRRLKDVTFVTIFGFISMTGVLSLLLYWLVAHYDPSSAGPAVNRPPPTPKSFLTTFFYTIYALNYQENVIGIYDELKDKSLRKMNKVYLIHSIIFVSFFSFVAISGNVLFRNHPDLLEEDVLTLFPPENIFVIFVKVLMIGTGFVSFTCTFKPFREILIDKVIDFKRGHHVEHRDVEEEYSQEKTIVFLTTALALFGVTITSAALMSSKVNFIDAIEYISSTIVPIVCIIIPVYVYSSSQKSIFAKIMFVFTCVMTFIQMLHTFGLGLPI